MSRGWVGMQWEKERGKEWNKREGGEGSGVWEEEEERGVGYERRRRGRGVTIEQQWAIQYIPGSARLSSRDRQPTLRLIDWQQKSIAAILSLSRKARLHAITNADSEWLSLAGACYIRYTSSHLFLVVVIIVLLFYIATFNALNLFPAPSFSSKFSFSLPSFLIFLFPPAATLPHPPLVPILWIFCND